MTAADTIAKIRGLRKILFNNLPPELADPVREARIERQTAKKNGVTPKPAGNEDCTLPGATVSKITLTTRDADKAMGTDLLYRCARTLPFALLFPSLLYQKLSTSRGCS